MDCGSLGILRSCMQFFIPSLLNLANLLMLSGIIQILIPSRYRYFNLGKESGIIKRFNSVRFSQLLRFRYSNFRNPYSDKLPKEWYVRLLPILNLVRWEISKTLRCCNL
ncbi:hypothetical protein ACB098_06G222900 [Castanea mollissima]